MEKEKVDELQSALNDTQQEQDKIKEQHPKQQQKEYVPNIRAVIGQFSFNDNWNK
jgi:FtsZ-binding cell division protein ZapB